MEKSKKVFKGLLKDKGTVRRLLLTFAVLLLLIFAVSFLGSRAFRNAVIDINTAHIEELAAHDVNIINNSVSSRLDTMEQVAESIVSRHRKERTPVLTLLRSGSVFIKGADKVILVSEDGTIYSSNNVIEARPDILKICLNEGERFVHRFDNKGDIIPDMHREYVLYGVKISPVEAEGHSFSYLCALIKPSALEDELKMDSYGGRGFSSVIDGEGNYILNINRSHSFMARDNFFKDISSVESFASTEDFQEALSGITFARADAKFNSDSYSEYYFVFTPMEETDWIFVSAIPSGVLEEQSRRLMNIAGLLLAVVVWAMIVTFFFSARSRKQQGELRKKEATDALNIQLRKQQDVLQHQQVELEKQHAALEEALSLAQSANRAKTTFLNNMSHDIRTPMNAIIGYTGLASSHLDNKDQVRDYLFKIGQSSEHLLSLINDVLDMSRIESGKVSIEEKEEDLAEILHTLRNIVQADINSKQMDLFIDTDVKDQFVMCDKLRLNQVLLNIVSNSIKYTQSGGMISLGLRETGITETGYARYEFRIRDNGMGMSEEFLKTIFDPFTRVKSSTVSGIQGTGLGMAITKNIIDMMGGTIDIRSKEGEGTETVLNFDFRLAEGKPVPVRIAELEGLKSLVVDDDMSACRNIAKMLRDTGMRSEWCASGKEAVIRTEEAVSIGDLFKVYIIDWMMPDMNGIETTRRIRQIVGDRAPIIVLTAYDWADIEDEAKEAGVTAFLSKPLFPSELHDVLNKCCGVDVAKAEPEKKFSFEGKKILLVEDNEMNREIAQEILSEEGFLIDTAEDGTVAVEKMKSAKPGQYDLILMDIQMPFMDGYEATRRIRALPDPEISGIPIVAMTANAFEEDRQDAFRAGMNDHLSKPIEISALKALLEKFLSSGF